MQNKIEIEISCSECNKWTKIKIPYKLLAGFEKIIKCRNCGLKFGIEINYTLCNSAGDKMKVGMKWK